MRGHGETGRKYPEAPTSLAVLEANDSVEVARYAKRMTALISLGGTYALSAALQDKDQENESLIQGYSILSSPMDLHGLIDHLSAACSITYSNVWYAIYSWLLGRYCQLRGLDHIRTFRRYADTVLIEPYYRDKCIRSLSNSTRQGQSDPSTGIGNQPTRPRYFSATRVETNQIAIESKERKTIIDNQGIHVTKIYIRLAGNTMETSGISIVAAQDRPSLSGWLPM
jgi:hypothetical protein